MTYQLTRNSRKVRKSFANKADATRFMGVVREQQGAMFQALAGIACTAHAGRAEEVEMLDQNVRGLGRTRRVVHQVARDQGRTQEIRNGTGLAGLTTFESGPKGCVIETPSFRLSTRLREACVPVFTDPNVVRWVRSAEMVAQPHAQRTSVQAAKGKALADTVEEFIAHKEERGRVKRTIDALRSELNRFVQATGSTYLREVTPAACKAYVYAPGLSKRTQVNRWLRLNNLLAWAADPKRDYLDRNPCDLVDKPYAPVPDVMPCIVTETQADRILIAAKEVGCLKIVALQLLAGLRPSEATEIRMEACQAEHIAVIGVGKLRNRCRRIVPVAPRLRELLPEMRKKAQQWPVTNKKKRAIEKKAGVKIGHDALRHTYVSMETALVGREMAAEYSGNSVEVIKRYYLNPQTAETAHRFFGESPRP